MKNINWDDLHLFLQVAECGGLSAAARTSGLSPATLGRRMLALEEQAGRALFIRSRTGYALTQTGETLAARVRAMRAAADPVEALLTDSAEPEQIRITAGTATAMFLADNHARLVRPEDGVRLNFLTTEAVLDIAHREAELGIRNRAPDSPGLASVRLGKL